MLIRHIIVATDESEAGRSAVRAGLDLAERALARVTVMRVVPLEALPLLGSAVGSVVGPDGAATALERLQRWLHAELRPGCPVPVELGIAFGLPGIEICRFAEQRQADLLVLGRKHRSAVARLLVGDTADAVVRRSRVPCLFVEHGAQPLSQLLVALDGSDRGMRVYAAARDFAQSVGLGLTVVTVESGDRPVAVDPVPPLPLTRSSRLWRELEPPASRMGTLTSYGGARLHPPGPPHGRGARRPRRDRCGRADVRLPPGRPSRNTRIGGGRTTPPARRSGQRAHGSALSRSLSKAPFRGPSQCFHDCPSMLTTHG